MWQKSWDGGQKEGIYFKYKIASVSLSLGYDAQKTGTEASDRTV